MSTDLLGLDRPSRTGDLWPFICRKNVAEGSHNRESLTDSQPETSDSQCAAGTSKFHSLPFNGQAESSWTQAYTGDSLQSNVPSVSPRLTSPYRRFDIFGNLPPEVSDMIAQHLDYYQIFRARRVSRRWNWILCEATCIHSHLRSWFPEGTLRLPIPARLSEGDVARLRFEQIDAFCNGRAFDMTIGKWGEDIVADYATNNSIFWRLAYADGRLACVNCSKPNVCFPVQLISSERTEFHVPSEVAILSVAVSTTLLAVMTQDDHCYVWKLSGGDDGNSDTSTADGFRLVSSYIDEFVVSDSQVAILYDRDKERRADVTIWNTESEDALDLVLPSDSVHCRGGHRRLLITHNGDCVIHNIVEHGNTTAMFVTRLDGSTVAHEWGFIYQDIDNFDEAPQLAMSGAKSRCATLYSFTRCTWLGSQDRYKWEVIRVCYNFDTDKPEVERRVAYGVGPQRQGHGEESFWWNNVASSRSQSDDPGELEVIDLRGGLCKRAELSASEFVPKHLLEGLGQEMSDEGDGIGLMLFGDETFLVSVWRGFYIAWCFNKTISFSQGNEQFSNYKRRLCQQQDERRMLDFWTEMRQRGPLRTGGLHCSQDLR